MKIIFFLFITAFLYSQAIPDLPKPICAGTAVVNNDSMFYFGGSSRWAGTVRYQTVYKYDGNSWNYYDSIPDNNVWGIESAVIDYNVYLFAGWPSGANFVRKYDLINKKWSYLNPSPNTVRYGITAEVVNGNIYLINTGGHVFEYNTTKNSWQKKTSNSVPAYSLSSAVINDEIYVIGFYDGSFYKYNPSLDQWIQLSSSPFQISACAMQGINDKIYFAGGSEHGSPMVQYNTLLEYSVSSDSWFIDQFELNEKRVWMADVIYKNKFFVLGGIDTGSQAVDFVEEIIPMGRAVRVKKKENKVLEYSLEQNYPNPFNPATVIRYIIPDKEDAHLLHLKVTLRVYDILGREISTLVDEEKQPGNCEVVFNPEGLSSGVYFYRITAGNFSDTKKLILLK